MTVHARMVKQRYIGPSNWNFLAGVKRHAGCHTILGSGDLFTADVFRMMNETGVDGASVARGAIGNPFIFRECRALSKGCAIASPSVAEQRDAIDFQLTETLKLHDAEHAGRIFRKFGISYANLHPMRNEVRQAFIDARNIHAIHEILAPWYDNQRDWPQPGRCEDLSDLIAAGAER